MLTWASEQLPDYQWIADLKYVSPYWPAVVIALSVAFGAQFGTSVSLSRRLRAKIKIEFKPGDPNFEATYPKDADGPARRTFRIRVVNESDEVVTNCSVKMVSMIDVKGTRSQYEGMPFRLRYDDPPPQMPAAYQQSFDIRGGDHEDIDIVELEETDPKGMLAMKYAPRAHSRFSIQNAIAKSRCPQVLTLKAVADNSTSDLATFRFYVDECGQLRFEWFKGWHGVGT